MKTRYWFVLAWAVLFSPPALAEDYVINVNGIVCEFCAYGVSKKVAKLDFIDRSKYDDGVDVAIENQMVTIAVKDGAVLDKDALYEAIRDAGYDPVAIFLKTADGELVEYQP